MKSEFKELQTNGANSYTEHFYGFYKKSLS